jgi:5-methylcytosine-specific restriction protein A
LSVRSGIIGVVSESELCVASRGVAAALARLRAGEQSASNGELLEQLKVNRRLRRQLDHSDVRIIATVKASGGFTERGVHPAPAVADLVGCGRGRSRRLVGLAERLFPTTSSTGEPLPPALPATATAWDGYEIDQAHAEVIDRALSTSAAERLDPDRRARLEVQLADLARTYPAHVLAGLGRELLEALDQDGAEPGRELDAQVNELFLSPDGDGVGGRIKGRLDSVTFDALRQAINGVIKPKADEGKSFGQRQADALGEICEHVLDEGHLPDSCGEKPHLTVTVSHEQLRRQLRGAASRRPGCGSGRRRSAASRVTRRSSRRSWGDVANPLDVGREQRIATKYQRRALAARDGGCAHPGCTRPPNWCSADHVKYWADGGPTDIDNLVLLCLVHHRMLHQSGWTIRIRNPLPEFIPPRWVDITQTPRPNPSCG